MFFTKLYWFRHPPGEEREYNFDLMIGLCILEMLLRQLMLQNQFYATSISINDIHSHDLVLRERCMARFNQKLSIMKLYEGIKHH